MAKTLLEEDPDTPVLLLETFDIFYKGFIHEKEFPGSDWRRKGFMHGPKQLVEDLGSFLSFSEKSAWLF